MVTGAVPTVLRAHWGDGKQKSPSGQLRREAEAETQQRGGPRTRRRGKRRGGNKEKKEEGRMRKGGLEIEKPRGDEGRRRQRQRQAESGMGPRRGDWSAPAPAPARRGSRHAAVVTDSDRPGPRPERAGSGAQDAARHPRGGGRGARGWEGDGRLGEGRWRSPLFFFSSPLSALNGSVIDWPRVLFSPQAAGARGRLISIFPAAARRSRPSCSRPPRRPRIYLWFNKKWELSQGLGLVKSSQHK